MANKYVTELLYFARLRFERNYDNLWYFTAAKGEGKSDASLLFSLEWMKAFGLTCVPCKNQWLYTKKLFVQNGEGTWVLKNKVKTEPCPACNSKRTKRITDLTFKFRKFLAYDNKEVIDMAIGEGKINEGCPMILDEGARVLMAEDWAKKENKRLKKVFAQMRTRNLLVIVNLPRFRWSDKKISNDMATGWLRILTRGMGVFMLPRKGLNKDPWGLDSMAKVMGEYDDMTSRKKLDSIAYNLFRKHQNVKQILRYPQVPKHIYKEYELERDQRALRLEEAEKKDEFDPLAVRDNLIHEMYRKGIPQGTIADIVGLSRGHINRVINIDKS